MYLKLLLMPPFSLKYKDYIFIKFYKECNNHILIMPLVVILCKYGNKLPNEVKWSRCTNCRWFWNGNYNHISHGPFCHALRLCEDWTLVFCLDHRSINHSVRMVGECREWSDWSPLLLLRRWAIPQGRGAWDCWTLPWWDVPWDEVEALASKAAEG